MFRKTLILLSALAFFINNIAFADIKFWTTETQPARMAKQEDMAKAFEAKTGIAVEVIPIDEKELGKRATAAAAAAPQAASNNHFGQNDITSVACYKLATFV